MLSLLIAVNVAFILFLALDLWLTSHDPYDRYPHMSESERTEFMAQEHDLRFQTGVDVREADGDAGMGPNRIGQESPALAEVAAEYQGWGAVPGGNDERSDHPKPFIQEIAGPDLSTHEGYSYSFRDRRANRQIAGSSGGTFAGDDAPLTMAGYEPPAMAGHESVSWGAIGPAEGGTRQGRVP